MISVIVPVYNVKSWIRKCINSILNQTYHELEIILVDDGSQDNSGKICDEYARKDHRIKVIHKPNGGAYSARNAGLDTATGEWIAFVDSDDWIEADMYEYMLKYAQQYQADLVSCDLRILAGWEQLMGNTRINEVIVQNAEQTRESCLNESIYNSCFNKLYRRELWDGVRFPTFQMAEDLAALWQIVKRVKISVRLPEAKYVYNVRSESLTTSKNIQIHLDDFQAVRKRHEEILRDFPQYEELSAKRCLMAARGAWDVYISMPAEEQPALKPKIREIVAFCSPYLRQYYAKDLGRIGRLQLGLLPHYPSGWAVWLVGKLNGLYARIHRQRETIPLGNGAGAGFQLPFDPTELKKTSRDYLKIADQELINLQNSRSYKYFLLGRRILTQLLRGPLTEKKDFFRWIGFKLTRRENRARPLSEFDPLAGARNCLKRVHYLNYLVDQMDLFERTDETFKQGKQIFIFAGVHYLDIGGGQRSAQMARTLNDMGYSVFYIYYMPHYMYHDFSDPIANGEAWCPAVIHCNVDHFSISILKRFLTKEPLFIFEVPFEKYLPYLEYAAKNGIPTVYEHIDNWDSTLGGELYQKAIFQRFLEKSSLITVTAKLLGGKIQEVSPGKAYLYLPNAVNSTLFEPLRDYIKPQDLVQGRKTLLYFGSLYGEWFDWEKVLYAAEHCDCEINLIGATDWIPDIVKNAPSNLHFLGEKKQDTLPAYLAHSDIAILPFKNCEIGKYVSPLKVFEYIAMNKPVLATPLDDISDYPNVFVSDEKEEWVRAIAQGWPVTDAGVFTSQNNWYARCNLLLRWTQTPPVESPSISIIILNRNNKKTIFRCVSSLLAFNERYHCEIIVVDNDSSDGSREELARQYGDRIVLVKNRKNGCSCGRNLGVRSAHGEFLFFLDSDQWAVSETYLDNAVGIFQRVPRIGAVGWAAGWFFPGKCAGPISDDFPNRAMQSPQVLFRTDIAYLGTGGLLMRKSLFEEINGFDEKYDPTCFEDTDLSLKIRYAGYELAYCPYIGISHLPHQTTQAGSGSHAKLMKKNGDYFMKKWQKLEPGLLEYYI